MRKTLKEERSLKGRNGRGIRNRFYQCQPQSLTYGDQFSDKNKFFQVRVAGGDRQCLTAFSHTATSGSCAKILERGDRLGMDLKTELRDMDLMNKYDFW